MSKIGRRPIEIGGVTVDIKGKEVHYKGKRSSGVYVLDESLLAELKGKELFVKPAIVNDDTNRLWGLHRALLNNRIKGADVGFKKQLRIVGLGYKAVLTGSNIQFSLGYSHKIDVGLPKNVTVEIDKTGQVLTFDSFDKDLLGQICSDIRALRPPEPYKGTGIQYSDEKILRKAGKAKA